MTRTAVFVLALALAGCATQYQSSGLTGGYSETQIDANVFRISATGNAMTSLERAEEMALLRAAELTLKNGFTHFTIADSRSRHDVVTIDGGVGYSTTTGTVSTYGQTATINARTQSVDDGPMTVRKPAATLTVVCYAGRPNVPGIIYDANTIIRSLGPKYGVAPAR